MNRLIRLVPELLILVKAGWCEVRLPALYLWASTANRSYVFPLVLLEGHCLRRKAGYEKTRGFYTYVVVRPIFPQNCVLCSNCRRCSSRFHILKFKAIRRHSPFQVYSPNL